MQRQKVVLTLSQRETLLEGYKSGVVRYSSVEENAAVDRLAEKAGLTSKRVKSFIDGENAKKRGNIRSKKLKLIQTRQLGPRDVFLSESWTGTKCSSAEMRDSSDQWLAVKGDQAEMERLKSAAVSINAARTNAVLTSEQMKTKLMLLVKDMQELINKIDVSGAEVLVMVCHREDGNVVTMGTESAIQFASSKQGLELQLASFCCGGSVADMTKPSDEDLRVQVQQMFNKKYQVATGGQKDRMSYKRMRSGLVLGDGFPPGIDLKEPSRYSRIDKERLLAAEQQISIKCVDTGIAKLSSPGQDSLDSGVVVQADVVLPSSSGQLDSGLMGDDPTPITAAPSNQQHGSSQSRKKIILTRDQLQSLLLGKPELSRLFHPPSGS